MCCHCTWAKSLKHLSQITKALNNCIAIDTAKLKFHIRYLMCTMYIDVHICDCTLRKTRFNNTRHLIKQHMHSNVIAIAQRLHIRQDPPLQICATQIQKPKLMNEQYTERTNRNPQKWFYKLSSTSSSCCFFLKIFKQALTLIPSNYHEYRTWNPLPFPD